MINYIDCCYNHRTRMRDYNDYGKPNCPICKEIREHIEVMRKREEEDKFNNRESCDNCKWGVLDEATFYVSCHYYPEEVQKAKDSFCSFFKKKLIEKKDHEDIEW